ncbi:MAG: hypothetical protein II886_13645 [Prevotella sp.]|nr:hypothetical protein [Prevotella sp.]
MRYNCISVDLDFLKKIIKERGMTERQVGIIMWGDKTHRGINDFQRRPNMRIETAMKLCNVLDISLDELFRPSEKVGQFPPIVGNENIINSSFITGDPSSLRSEIKALRALLREKDARIEDLKSHNEELNKRLDFLIHFGQNSDSR